MDYPSTDATAVAAATADDTRSSVWVRASRGVHTAKVLPDVRAMRAAAVEARAANIAVPEAEAADGAAEGSEDSYGPFTWTTSFDVDDVDGQRAFFSEHGFVVVRDALTADRVAKTLKEVWTHPTLLGWSGEVDPSNPDTWGDEDWPIVDNNRGFLDAGDQTVLREAWRNFQDPRVVSAFQNAFGDEVLGGRLQRYGVLRPAGVNPAWRTDEVWPHWDQHPWSEPGFRRLQGLIALTDNTPGGGGFSCVPGFHLRFDEWAKEHPEPGRGAAGAGTDTAEGEAATVEADSEAEPEAGPARDRGVLRHQGPTPVPAGDPIYDSMKTVTMRAGSLLLWDSRLPHQNFPNDGAGFRVVQYQTYARMGNMSRDHALAVQERATLSLRGTFSFGGRYASVARRGSGSGSDDDDDGDGDDDAEDEDDADGPGFPELLTPLGRRLAGLDLWPCHAESAGAAADGGEAAVGAASGVATGDDDSV